MSLETNIPDSAQGAQGTQEPSTLPNPVQAQGAQEPSALPNPAQGAQGTQEPSALPNPAQAQGTQGTEDSQTFIDAQAEEFARKRAFKLPDGIPAFNIGAFFMPPIWGPAHGQWMTILFYPLWVFTDSVFMAAYKQQTTFTIISAILLGICMTAVTVFYGATVQKAAYYRVKDKFSPEEYVRRERIWAVAMVALGIVFIALATYFNLYMYDSVWAGVK